MRRGHNESWSLYWFTLLVMNISLIAQRQASHRNKNGGMEERDGVIQIVKLPTDFIVE